MKRRASSTAVVASQLPSMAYSAPWLFDSSAKGNVANKARAVAVNRENCTWTVAEAMASRNLPVSRSQLFGQAPEHSRNEEIQ